jgi:hypothetical protein
MGFTAHYQIIYSAVGKLIGIYNWGIKIDY